MGYNWKRAAEELRNPNPDWKIVVSVIRGHSCLEKLTSYTNTTDAIREYEFTTEYGKLLIDELLQSVTNLVN
jgi:hypothetical protein